MKKIIVLLLPLLIIVGLSAVQFEVGGEFRTRAAMYNDTLENDGGHIDNRLLLNLSGKLHPTMSIVYNAEIGDIVWGGAGGGIGTRGVNVETSELYLEYKCVPRNMNIKVGQQYFADHRSLVIDDNFSGLMITKEDFFGFQAELAYMVAMERANVVGDDYHVAMFNLYKEMGNMNAGLQTFYGNDLQAADLANFTLMPFVTLPLGPVELDATAFIDYQVNPGDETIGFGAAVKAMAEVGPLHVGGDLLYTGENGLSTLSPYYQNGLYLFGIGNWHDGVTVAFPYPFGNNGLMSIVGNVGYNWSEKTKLFANAGYVTTMADNDPGVGFELNAGIERCIIPEMVKIAAYGAIASPGEAYDGDLDPNMLYLLGTTIKINY